MKKIIFFLITIFSLFSLIIFYPIKEKNKQTLWTFYDINGELLFSEKPYSQDFTQKQKIPTFFKKGLINIEDQNFYSHFGIDFFSLLRASKQNLKSKKIVSGASTITMQLAKLMFLEEEKRNIWYKIRQSFYALKLETKFSKEEILEKYISKINFGIGSVGLSSAANKYFSKTPETLSLGEIATLIGTMGNPSLYNPLTHPDKSKKRKNLILDIWYKKKFISKEDLDFWKNKKTKLNITLQNKIHAPHFVFWVKNKIINTYPEIIKNQDEIYVYTTLDKSLYQKLLTILRNEIKNNEKDNNAHNAGLIEIDLKLNQIKAMIGSVNFFDKNIDGAVNMTTSKRSTGSILKPFLYALALDENYSMNIEDKLISFPTKKGRYMPRNFDIEKEYGLVWFREALSNSYNLSAVNLLNKIGLKKFIKKLNEIDLNIGKEDNLGLSAILGGGEESLLNLTTAYTIFPKEGIFEKPKFLIDIKNKNNISLLPTKKQVSKKIFTISSSNWITHTLSDNQVRWKNFKRGNVLEVDRPAGVKTGTSQEFKDNWTIGFSPDFALGVWVGNARGAPLHTSSGVEGAGNIWNKTFRFLHKDLLEKNFIYNSNRKEISVCRRPYEQYNCSEKITDFLLPEEITKTNKIDSKNKPKFSISFPSDGDIFHKNSEILLKVRNIPNNTNLQYFIDNNPTDNHLFHLSSGRHTIWAKSKESITDKINIFVEK